MPLMNTATPQATTSQFYSPALSTEAMSTHAKNLGLHDNRAATLVTDIDDINQCIHIIILTPKGSDPHRPLFGCDQDKYIDAPVNVVRPHLVREATDALRMWEPRIIVERVLVTLSDIAAVDCSIVWRFADASVEEAFVTNLSLGMANIVGSAA